MSADHSPAHRYPKSGPVGGRLIRKVVGFLRKQGVQLPLTSDILIAVSGGSDSVALSHLLTHYGRKMVHKSQIRFVHINHGWRGKESDQDEVFVGELAKKWGVELICRRLSPPSVQTGEKPLPAPAVKHPPSKHPSWEDLARTERKKIFQELALQFNAQVWTAHQAEDVAETMLWRIFSGAAKTHGAGILFRHGCELRPFLSIRKAELRDYLKEVGQGYREDSSNDSLRFLRARMRKELMPVIEKLFPRSVDHLVNLALQAQEDLRVKDEAAIDNGERVPIYNSHPKFSEFIGSTTPYSALLQAAGLRIRRPHWEALSQKTVAGDEWQGEIHLPGGWKLLKERAGRWVLEKIQI